VKSVEQFVRNGSKSFRERNPALMATHASKNDTNGRTGSGKAKRGEMNKTEADFALILEAQKRNGDILRYEYEGITLRFASVRYTPDFVVFGGPTFQRPYMPKQLKFIEVKGPFTKGKYERAIERFRHARTYWSEFSFELWKKQKTGWKQIL
jgi:hypothetical protein